MGSANPDHLRRPSRSRNESRSRTDRPPRRKESLTTPPTADHTSEEPPEPPDPEKVFPNYQFGPGRRWVAIVLWISNVLVLSLLAAVAFAPPSQMSGGPAVLKTSDEFVGVLRKCSANSCDPWMAGDSGQSEGTYSYGKMYLTTGLATLTALWFAIFVVLFSLYRTFRRFPPVEGGTVWDGAARFTYRAGRTLLVVNVILVPSVIIDVLVKAVSYRNAKSISGFNIIGGGLALLFFAFLFTLLSTLIELRGPEGRTNRWIMKTNCFGCCGLGGTGDQPKDVEEGRQNKRS